MIDEQRPIIIEAGVIFYGVNVTDKLIFRQTVTSNVDTMEVILDTRRKDVQECLKELGWRPPDGTV